MGDHNLPNPPPAKLRVSPGQGGHHFLYLDRYKGPVFAGLTVCNNPIVIRYATGNDSYFLNKQVSLFYPKVYGSTIYSESTELACLSRVIRRRILSRQIVIWVDCRA